MTIFFIQLFAWNSPICESANWNSFVIGELVIIVHKFSFVSIIMIWISNIFVIADFSFSFSFYFFGPDLDEISTIARLKKKCEHHAHHMHLKYI